MNYERSRDKTSKYFGIYCIVSQRKSFGVDEELPLLLRTSILQEKMAENLG